MGRIVKLPPDVANRIAAGEVVERPASVVKELVENSLDARASRIRVELEGGVELIRVQDDGEGMDPEDALLCFARHATSKLRSPDDLERVATYGFRGEALAAIAAVAEVELVSRPAGGPAGYRVVVRGGEEVDCGPFPSGPGTLVSVRRLFFNAPARRRFLRSAPAERRACIEVVQRLALARPDVAMELRIDGEVRLATPGDGDPRSAAAAVLGPEVAARLVEVSAQRGPARVRAHLSPPGEHRPTRSHLWVYVNGRWVEDRMVAAATARGYESALPSGRYPVGIIALTLDPSLVDVNVHPAKLHVRFRDEKLIFATVAAAARQVLHRAPIPPLSRELPAGPHPGDAAPAQPSGQQEAPAMAEGFEGPAAPEPGGAPGVAAAAAQAREASGAYLTGPTLLAATHGLTPGGNPVAGEGPCGPGVASRAPAELIAAPSVRVLGQVFRTYLVVEAPGALLLVDQHVAHERLIYERLRAARMARAGPVPSQELLEPVTLRLSPSRSQALHELAPVLAQLGLVVEPFGPVEWRVRALPVEPGLPPPAGPRDIEELLEALAEAGTDAPAAGAGGVMTPATDRLLKTLACRSAVKAGQQLPAAWWERLVAGLAEADNPYTCPHGRPVVVQLSLYELHRRFGRSGPVVGSA